MENERQPYDRYIGRRIFVILKNGRKYSGVIEEIVFLATNQYLMTILDKFNKHVSFNVNEIEAIEEERRGDNGKQ